MDVHLRSYHIHAKLKQKRHFNPEREKEHEAYLVISTVHGCRKSPGSQGPPQPFKGIRRTPRFPFQAKTHHTVGTPRFPQADVSIPLPHGTHDVTPSLRKAPFRSLEGSLATRDDVTPSLRKAPFRSLEGSLATRDDVTPSLRKAPFRSLEGSLATRDDVTPSLRKAIFRSLEGVLATRDDVTPSLRKAG
ncbi:unnamed protein product [Prunus armeniaca]